MADPRRKITLYIDPSSPRFLGDRLFDVGETQYVGSDLLAPYVHLREALAAHGVAVHTADYLPEEGAAEGASLYVAITNLKNYRRLAARRDVVLSACIAMECPVVDPSLYRGLRRAQHAFKRVLSWSDSASLERFVGAPLDCEPFFWPQSYGDVHEPIWRQADRRFLVMINSNKLPALYWNELYTERLRAVAFFSEHGEIDLYGTGWDRAPLRLGHTWVPWTLRRLRMAALDGWDRLRPDPLLVAARRAYRGRAASKAETLGQYTFALCFENSVLKGWITEKIFDCFFSGTIPVYWGAPDVEAHIPADCFIDMRQFSGYDELRSYLKSLGEADVRRYKEAARDFLRSPRYYPFSKEAFVARFIQMIEEDAGVQLEDGPSLSGTPDAILQPHDSGTVPGSAK